MKPKHTVNVGAARFVLSSYTHEEVVAYQKAVHNKLLRTLEDLCPDDLDTFLSTPYGCDAKIVYKAAVYDKTGMNVVKNASLAIYEVEETGELPLNKTIQEWRIMVIEAILESITHPTSKSQTIDSVNKLINSIMLKPPVKAEEKKHEEIDFKEFIRNDESGKKDSLPVRLATLGQRGGIINTNFEVTLTRPVEVTQPGFFTNHTVEEPTESIVVPGQWWFCKDGDYYFTEIRGGVQGEPQLFLKDCELCQTTRTRFKRLVNKITGFFASLVF